MLWAANLPSSMDLPILLAFPPRTTKESSPGNKSTTYLPTRSHRLQFFPLSCGWIKISNTNHDWVPGIKLKPENNFKPEHSLFLLSSPRRCWQNSPRGLVILLRAVLHLHVTLNVTVFTRELLKVIYFQRRSHLSICLNLMSFSF